MDLIETLNEALKGKFRRFGSNITQTKEECNYFPKNKKELKDIIKERVDKDRECDLNDVWVGDITDMNFLFHRSYFNGDISRWDVSNVEYMSDMFSESHFDGDISSWNVSNVKNMERMFNGAIKFNQNLSSWTLYDERDGYSMFDDCPIKDQYKPKGI